MKKLYSTKEEFKIERRATSAKLSSDKGTRNDGGVTFNVSKRMASKIINAVASCTTTGLTIIERRKLFHSLETQFYK